MYHSRSSKIVVCDNKSPVASPHEPESYEVSSFESAACTPIATTSSTNISRSQSPSHDGDVDTPRWSPTTSTPFQAMLVRHQNIPANVLVSSSPFCRARNLTSTIHQGDEATGEKLVDIGVETVRKPRALRIFLPSQTLTQTGTRLSEYRRKHDWPCQK